MHGEKTHSEETKSGETGTEKKTNEQGGKGLAPSATPGGARDDGKKAGGAKRRRALRILRRQGEKGKLEAEARKAAKAKLEGQIAVLNQKIHLL